VESVFPPPTASCVTFYTIPEKGPKASAVNDATGRKIQADIAAEKRAVREGSSFWADARRWRVDEPGGRPCRRTIWFVAATLTRPLWRRGPGDNLYTDSIVAVNPQGPHKCHFSTSPTSVGSGRREPADPVDVKDQAGKTIPA